MRYTWPALVVVEGDITSAEAQEQADDALYAISKGEDIRVFLDASAPVEEDS